MNYVAILYDLLGDGIRPIIEKLLDVSYDSVISRGLLAISYKIKIKNGARPCNHAQIAVTTVGGPVKSQCSTDKWLTKFHADFKMDKLF